MCGDGSVLDVSGLIGQYAHGNEPCHHVAYLYNFAGAPLKTQDIIYRIKNTLYSNTRDGLCGNDDCGQMSAWYVFSTMGFYPVCPGSGYYAIGCPSFKRVKIKLPDDAEFTVLADNISEARHYIMSRRLNGTDLIYFELRVEDVLKGGVLEFAMETNPY